MDKTIKSKSEEPVTAKPIVVIPPRRDSKLYHYVLSQNNQLISSPSPLIIKEPIDLDEKTLLERKEKLMTELLEIEGKLATIEKVKLEKAKEMVVKLEKIQEKRQKSNEEFMRKMGVVSSGEPPAKQPRVTRNKQQ